MAVKACLNGGRTRSEHPAVPLTPAELAADAIAVRSAGAFAVHLHPRDDSGRETMQARACDAAVGAIRAAVPGMAVGLSTSEAIDPDPFARAAAISTWRQAPDFVSVNLSELGWVGIVRAALHAGIAVEVGLAAPDEVEQFAAQPVHASSPPCTRRGRRRRGRRSRDRRTHPRRRHAALARLRRTDLGGDRRRRRSGRARRPRGHARPAGRASPRGQRRARGRSREADRTRGVTPVARA